MRGLTLQEPWATLVWDGRKTIETRTWATKYRGELLLTASRYPVGTFSGEAFMVVELYDVRPMRAEDEAAACCPVYPRAHAWLLRNLRRIERFPLPGEPMVWELLGIQTRDIVITATINRRGCK